MGADYSDMVAKLQMAQAQQQNQGPSLFGLQSQMDPNTTAAILKKLQDQQYVAQAGNENAGEYSYLANAGKKDQARVGQALGNLLGVGQPAPQDNSAVMQQRQAIQQGKQQLSQGLAQGQDPNAIQMQVLSSLAQAGVPGAADALEKANTAASKLRLDNAQVFKDTAQGNASNDEIGNRATVNARQQSTQDMETNKNTWSTVSETPQTVVQKNGLGEVRVQQKMPAAQAAAANVTPDAMQAMLDSYHTTGTVPGGLARSPAMAGAFWDAEAKFQQSTGNTAASVLAQKSGAKADSDALSQTQKQISQTTSYFDTMDKNIARARQLGNSIDFSDATSLNKALAAWNKGMSDPTYAKYNVFFDSVANEYAKIKSGALGNAPVSDSARHEAQSVISQTIGNGGMNAAFDAIKEEGQNRLDSLSAQRTDLVNRLSKKPGVTNAPAQPTTPASPNVVDFSSLK